MKSKQQVFFLTKSDLIKMMSVVEEKVPLEYILMGGICFLVYISIMQSVNVKHKISYCFPKKCSFAARDFNNFIID